MQTSISNIDAFIAKINIYVTYIITFLKTTFNNIIAIKNVDFHLGNILNSSGIIINFIFALLYILIFITFLIFIGSIFNIIKTIIRWISCPFKLLFKLIKWILTPKSPVNQPITNNELDELQKKIVDLESKNNLMMKYINEQNNNKRRK